MEQKIIGRKAYKSVPFLLIVFDELPKWQVAAFRHFCAVVVCHSRERNRARGYYHELAQKLRRPTLTWFNS